MESAKAYNKTAKNAKMTRILSILLKTSLQIYLLLSKKLIKTKSPIK